MMALFPEWDQVCQRSAEHLHKEPNMRKLVPLILVILCVSTGAQEDYETEETVYATSCSLSVKTTVYNADPGDVVGKASIEATLSDKSGVPIPGQTIAITATSGTFTCIPPYGTSGTGSSDRSCFVTGPDGKIIVYLVDIPFNKPGRIKATCAYGDFVVHAASSYSITRNVIKKKNSRNPPARKSTGN
jgi:hypothetical protein